MPAQKLKKHKHHQKYALSLYRIGNTDNRGWLQTSLSYRAFDKIGCSQTAAGSNSSVRQYLPLSANLGCLVFILIFCTPPESFSSSSSAPLSSSYSLSSSEIQSPSSCLSLDSPSRSLATAFIVRRALHTAAQKHTLQISVKAVQITV